MSAKLKNSTILRIHKKLELAHRYVEAVTGKQFKVQVKLSNGLASAPVM